MTLIIENGKVINRTDSSIDSLKREPYKHGVKESVDEELEDFNELVDDKAETEPVLANDMPLTDEESLQLGLRYSEFKAFFLELFKNPSESIMGAMEEIEGFIRDNGGEADLGGAEEIPNPFKVHPGQDDIKGDQITMTSYVEEE